jgi:hypothetical protein
VTVAERLQRAEQLVLRLEAEGVSLDPDRRAKVERLRLLARLEGAFPGCRVLNAADPLPSLETGESHAVYFVSGKGQTTKVSPGAASVADATCTACDRRAWWLSIHGAVVCGRCHPPASNPRVERWIGLDQPETGEAS